jgi:hypothetical protein
MLFPQPHPDAVRGVPQFTRRPLIFVEKPINELFNRTQLRSFSL